MKTHLSTFPDEDFPNKDMVDGAGALLRNNQQYNGYFFTDAHKTKAQKQIRVIEEEATENSVAHPDGDMVWTRLSTDTMQQLYSKSKRPYDQATTMGRTSAPAVSSHLPHDQII